MFNPKYDEDIKYEWLISKYYKLHYILRHDMHGCGNAMFFKNLIEYANIAHIVRCVTFLFSV